MGWALGPINTADQYPAASIGLGLSKTSVPAIETVACVRLNLIVQNASVLYQVKRMLEGGGGAAGYFDSTEKYLPALANQITFVSLDRLCCGIRFRSFTAGSPGLVFCELLEADEIPTSADMSGGG